MFEWTVMEDTTRVAVEADVVLKVKQVCGSKWSGEVVVALSDSTLALKEKLHRLTGQPVRTMKLMCAGR